MKTVSDNPYSLWVETVRPRGRSRAVLVAEGSPSEICAGGSCENGKLRDFFHKHYSSCRSQAGWPESVIAGRWTYEGDYWFGLFQGVRWVTPEDWVPVQGAWRVEGLTATPDEAGYCLAVQKARDYIRAGDIYQVNIARLWQGSFTGSAEALFSRMKETSPAPCAAWIRTPEFSYLSASPELFLHWSEDRVATEPIKGTRPRGGDAAEDARLLSELCQSPKERAELLMITDLERSDLGQFCCYGSVRVESFAEVRSFAQVHHLVSTVSGEVRAGVAPWDLLLGCFPGGSITGAPKKRAMEIIRELETRPRGVFCGSAGFFAPGFSHFNISIRTMEIGREGVLQFGAGSGITHDSDARQEYLETEHKASGVLQALTGG